MGHRVSLHRIGEARQALHTALAGVLEEGRVAAYPPAQDVGVRVWIDVPSIGVNGHTIDVDFPVHCTYDGADVVQVAGLDDVVSRVWDACEAVRNTTPLRVSPGADIGVNGSTRRRQIVTVRSSIAARTLCLPDTPAASFIPPDQVQE